MSADRLTLMHRLQALHPLRQRRVLAPFERRFAVRAVRAWPSVARDEQLPPPGDWRVWLIMAGRGFGKTRAGAEWVDAFARSHPGSRIALVGATADDVRHVMIEGEAGILACATTTPRAVPLMRVVLGMVGLVRSGGSTLANEANLSSDFVATMRNLYGDTMIGRQEIGGELIEDVPGALWTRVLS